MRASAGTKTNNMNAVKKKTDSGGKTDSGSTRLGPAVYATVRANGVCTHKDISPY